MPLYYRCIGTNVVTTRQLLKNGLGPGFPVDQILEVWAKKYTATARVGSAAQICLALEDFDNGGIELA